jgi:alpha-soluble NSF attachment protein
VDQRWVDSGKAFEREAGCRLKADEKHDAMNAFHNAAKSYKKTDPAGELAGAHALRS